MVIIYINYFPSKDLKMYSNWYKSCQQFVANPTLSVTEQMVFLFLFCFFAVPIFYNNFFFFPGSVQLPTESSSPEAEITFSYNAAKIAVDSNGIFFTF
jgi:hypothetical protein